MDTHLKLKLLNPVGRRKSVKMTHIPQYLQEIIFGLHIRQELSQVSVVEDLLLCGCQELHTRLVGLDTIRHARALYANQPGNFLAEQIFLSNDCPVWTFGRPARTRVFELVEEVKDCVDNLGELLGMSPGPLYSFGLMFALLSEGYIDQVYSPTYLRRMYDNAKALKAQVESLAYWANIAVKEYEWGEQEDIKKVRKECCLGNL